MRLILIIMLCSLWGFGAYPQSGTEQSSPTKSTFFLVDASGTMKEWRDDALSMLNARKTLLHPQTQISVSFFGQLPEFQNEVVDCDDPVKVTDLGPNSNEITFFPQVGRDEDTTAIGQALLAALGAAGEYAHVVLITDGNDECASDFASIRRMYPNANIEVYQVGNEPNTALELLELSSFPIASSSTVELPSPVIIDFSDKESEWETAEPLARWNWLIGILILMLAIVVFGIQYGLKAHTIERHLKQLRDEKRKSQDGKLDVGDSEKHYQETISALRKYGSYWWPVAIFSFGVLYILILTFGPDSHFGVSRKMAWLVLSSSFAIVFSVLTSTPLFFASSQYWRSVQAKQTFENEVDLAKIVELQQQRAKHAQDYRDYKQLQRMIADQNFATPWPSGSWGSLSSSDKTARRIVEKRAAYLASGDQVPDVDPAVVTKELERLKRYRVEWPTNPKLDAWIILMTEDGLLHSESWALLRERIEAGSLEEIKTQFSVVSTEIQRLSDEQIDD